MANTTGVYPRYHTQTDLQAESKASEVERISPVNSVEKQSVVSASVEKTERNNPFDYNAYREEKFRESERREAELREAKRRKAELEKYNTEELSVTLVSKEEEKGFLERLVSGMNQFQEDSRMDDQLMAQVIVEKTAAAYHYFDGLYTYGKEYMEEIEEENRELEQEGKEFLADKTKEAVDKITTVNNNNAALEQKILLEQMELIGDAGKAVADTGKEVAGILVDNYQKSLEVEQMNMQMTMQGHKLWHDIFSGNASALTEEERAQVHLALDVMSMLPGGIVADYLNYKLYSAEGDDLNAALSLGAMALPGAIEGGGKVLKMSADVLDMQAMQKIVEICASVDMEAVLKSADDMAELGENILYNELKKLVLEDLAKQGIEMTDEALGWIAGMGDEVAEVVTDSADDVTKKLADAGADATGGLDEIAGVSDDVAVNSAGTLAEPKNLVDNVGDTGYGKSGGEEKHGKEF